MGRDKITVAGDEDIVAANAAWDGQKGCISNAEMTAQELIAANHRLYNVEQSFKDYKVEAGDPSDIPLQPQQNQGTHLHLLCCVQNL